MALTDHAPCWPDPEPDPACCPAWATATPALREQAARAAAYILWAASGRRHGVCTVTVRPCRDCSDGTTYYGRGPMAPPFVPVLQNGVWRNCGTGCDCPGPCSCCHVCAVPLEAPAQEIVEVRVDGQVVDPAAYRIDDHRELVRVDGECWPSCSDLSAPCDEVGGGGFCVTYRRGVPLDAAAMFAYETYACQLLAACTNDSCCRLPKRVTSITREGVTMAMLDPMEMLDKGRTGLYEVDAWLAAVNPAGLRQAPRVYSPDRRPARVTTWP